jgi:predicted transcriptional regulator
MASRVVGVRLQEDLAQKLQALCEAAHQRPSAVLRHLVSAATPDQLKTWREGSGDQ